MQETTEVVADADTDPSADQSPFQRGGLYPGVNLIGPTLTNPRPLSFRGPKTYPCKYFHGAKGCNFGDGCTFIHENTF